MCGIVGYIGDRPVQEVLLEGLRKLEYRGYDSAGISILDDGHFSSTRAVGNLDALYDALSEAAPPEGAPVALAERAPTTGIGHTRWATHGRVNEANAHPHSDDDERVHVVVNGIVENYMEIKEALIAEGATFSSETDAEVIAHLISRHIEAGDGLVDAVLAAYARIRGHYAFVAVSADEPELLVGARKECPLVIGRGEGEQFVASAIPAFLSHTRQVQLIENDEIVVVRRDGVEFLSAAGEPIERAVDEVDWSQEVAEKGGYETFMLKEIHEQADAVAETIADRTVRADGVDLGDLGTIDDAFLRDCNRIVVVACGTSYHAGLIGRYAMEQWARVPVEMDIASEYRYRDPVVGPRDLVVGIT
jgi:glutamine---fructose-6-phosphate transaminase (isomerizing)